MAAIDEDLETRDAGELRELVEREALAANRATPALDDPSVAAALQEAGRVLRGRGKEVLAGNAEDCDAARGRMDSGMLDRRRLDGRRLDTIAAQLESMAGEPPLEREAASWRLSN